MTFHTIVLTLVIFSMTACTRTRVINPKNAYGGKSVAVYVSKYSKDAKRRGNALVIRHFDKKGVCRRENMTKTRGYTLEMGVRSEMCQYDEKGTLRIREIQFTPHFASKKNLIRRIFFYTEKGKPKQREDYYGPKHMEATGQAKNTLYYRNGREYQADMLLTEKAAKQLGFVLVRMKPMKTVDAQTEWSREYINAKGKTIRFERVKGRK